ncbi:MAG: TetR/AcrR family transcriptional regulator [Deltaproteobacteria bacterium]|nr:TetR/AcrR family transcriptional regulator [Deltaproteobacteria bacterium]
MAKTLTKPREKTGDTPKKLIDVSIDLFSRKGFKGTSIRDIASEMNMTTSNIYHYFGTKNGLLSAIERQTLDPLLKELKQITQLDLPAKDRLKKLIKAHLTYMDAHRKESLIFSFNEEYTSSRTRKFQEETLDIYRSEIKRLLEHDGVEKDPTIFALFSLGTIIWFLRWYRPTGRFSLDEIIDMIADYVLNGITGNSTL